MGGQGAKARSIAWCDDGTTPTLKSAPSGGNTVPDVVYPKMLVLNDQGGARMNVDTIANTLRAQMNHHEPIVCMVKDG